MPLLPRAARRPRRHLQLAPAGRASATDAVLPVLVLTLALAGCAGPASPAPPPLAGLPASADAGCYHFEIAPARVPRGAVREGGHVEVPMPTPDVLAVRVMATNRTAAPCPGPDRCGVSGGWLVLTATGSRVATFPPVGVACPAVLPPTPPVLPGHSVLWASFAWDGHGDFTGPCQAHDACHVVRPNEPPGLYRVRWSWLDQVQIETGPVPVLSR